MESTVDAWRRMPGKDIWLFGGGSVFRSPASAETVDTVEVAIMPALPDAGTPFLPGQPDRIRFSALSQKVCGAGIVALKYAVREQTAV